MKTNVLVFSEESSQRDSRSEEKKLTSPPNRDPKGDDPIFNWTAENGSPLRMDAVLSELQGKAPGGEEMKKNIYRGLMGIVGGVFPTGKKLCSPKINQK